MPSQRIKARWGALGLLALLVACGCSRPAREIAPERAGGLNQIRSAYEQSQTKLGRPPENLNDLKPYLEGDADELARKYEIVWGVDYHKMSMPPPVVAYEKTAVNGQRYVVTVMGVVPMSADEFAKAIPHP
jgi:hypothetical protein